MRIRDKYILDSTTSYYSDPLCVGEVACKDDKEFREFIFNQHGEVVSEDDELVGVFPAYPPNEVTVVDMGMYNAFMYEAMSEAIESFYIAQTRIVIELQKMLKYTKFPLDEMNRFLNKILYYTVLIYLADYYLSVDEIPNLYKITDMFHETIPEYAIDYSSMEMVNCDQLYYSQTESALFLVSSLQDYRKSSMLITDWDTYLEGDTDEE